MATKENTEEKVVEVEVEIDATKVEKSGDSDALKEALERIEKLENINKELIEKRDKVKTNLRSKEEEASVKDDALSELQKSLEEANDKASSLQKMLRNKDIDTHLEKGLMDLGLTDEAISTASALVDRTTIKYNDNKGLVDKNSLNKALDALKDDHPILFNAKPKVPDVKRPIKTENITADSYTKELMKAAQSGNRAQMDEIRKKFGKT